MYLSELNLFYYDYDVNGLLSFPFLMLDCDHKLLIKPSCSRGQLFGEEKHSWIRAHWSISVSHWTKCQCFHELEHKTVQLTNRGEHMWFAVIVICDVLMHWCKYCHTFWEAASAEQADKKSCFASSLFAVLKLKKALHSYAKMHKQNEPPISRVRKLFHLCKLNHHRAYYLQQRGTDMGNYSCIESTF